MLSRFAIANLLTKNNPNLTTYDAIPHPLGRFPLVFYREPCYNQPMKHTITYALVRTKRKTVAIYVRPDGSVEVRAPLRTPKRDIERFLAEKEDWIRTKQSEVRTRIQRRSASCLDYGGAVRLMGQSVPIAEAKGRAHFDGQRFCLPPGLDEAEIRTACESIYRTLARAILPEKTAYYAAKMGLDGAYAQVKITGAKTSWGSCSSRDGVKRLNFSWRLMMADMQEIDYVVVHELAHLRQMNHSPQFWAEVSAIVPDYKQRRLRLKQLQAALTDEGRGF